MTKLLLCDVKVMTSVVSHWFKGIWGFVCFLYCFPLFHVNALFITDTTNWINKMRVFPRRCSHFASWLFSLVAKIWYNVHITAMDDFHSSHIHRLTCTNLCIVLKLSEIVTFTKTAFYKTQLVGWYPKALYQCNKESCHFKYLNYK